MELTNKQNLNVTSALLFLTVLTQAIYTALYVGASDVPRQWLWSLEGLVFVLLMAFAGSALARANSYTLGFSAIFASAILNFLQVGIGLTQFGPFREVSQAVEGIAPAAGGIFAFSFFIYNAAKILLGLGAVVFGSALSQAGSKLIGRLAILIGLAAVVTNAIVMTFGRIEGVPSGATGAVATLMLAVCLFKLNSDD